MNQFQAHAESYGTVFEFDEITKIKKEDDTFVLTGGTKEYKTKSLILAFGLVPRELDIPGEEEYKGRGVSFCATCDAPLYKDKVVAVVGGGNSALDAADLLAKLAKKVYLIHRKDNFRAEQVWSIK